MFTMLDTSPESLKKLSDYMNKLYNLAYDQDGSALRTDSIKRKNITTAAVGTDEVADDAITTSKIVAGSIITEHISTSGIIADCIKGGTLSLGGFNNINGKFQIYNASGVLTGYCDNVGLNFGNSGTDCISTLTASGLNFYKGTTTVLIKASDTNMVINSTKAVSIGNDVSISGVATANIFKTTGSLPLQISSNSIDSTVSSNLWLNYYSGSNVQIGNGTQGGLGNLYCANLYASSAVFANGVQLTNYIPPPAP